MAVGVAAEVKNNRSFIRADDRLSKEGLVRHLCLSQHSYQGNWKVKDGEPAYEILTTGHGESLWTRSLICHDQATTLGETCAVRAVT